MLHVHGLIVVDIRKIYSSYSLMWKSLIVTFIIEKLFLKV